MSAWPAPRQAWLCRRRPHARGLYANRVRVDDVVHTPSGPLEVLAVVRRPEGPVVLTVLDYFPTGEPYEWELVHDPLRELRVSRPSKVPRHLQDEEWVAAQAA